MNNPKFKYYLRVPNGSNYDYYYCDSSNNVTFTTSATPTRQLQYSPEGWQNSTLNWERGFTYHGIIRAVTFPIEFVKDGAKILRNFYYNNGIEADVELYIEIFDSATYTYGAYYQGNINFNGSKDSFDRFICEASEGGFLQKLESKESTNYEIPIDTNGSKIWVKLHSCYLQFKQKWITSYGDDVNTHPYHAPSTGEGTNLYLGIYEENPSDPVFNFLSNESTSSQTVNLEYRYNYDVYVPSTTTAGAPYQFHIYYSLKDIATSTEVTKYTIFQQGSPYMSSGASQNFIGLNTQSITIPVGHKLVVEVQLDTTVGPPGHVNDASYTCTQRDSYCIASIDQATAEGYFPALRWRDVATTLLSDINGSTVTLSSTPMGVTHYDKVLTSGDAIRNLENSVLKTNFADDFTSFNANFGASFYYKSSTNTAYIGTKADVYYNSQILDLGEAADLTQEPFVQEMFSRLKNGQDNQTYDNVNGKDEFNNETEWATPINAVSNEKNLKSVYRKDMYGILLTYLNLNGKKVTDSDSDNDVFIVHIGSSIAGTIPAGFDGAGEDYYDIYIDPSWSVTNVYRGDAAFNVELSPLRNIYNNGDYLHSMFYGLDSQYITFQTNSKSNYTGTKMISTTGGVTYDEGANILITDLPDPLFKPMVVDVKLKVPVNLYSTLATNPYGYVKTTWLGNTYKGYILKISQSPALSSEQTIKLLLTTDTVITNLIR